MRKPSPKHCGFRAEKLIEKAGKLWKKLRKNCLGAADILAKSCEGKLMIREYLRNEWCFLAGEPQPVVVSA
jgi:hypothetical protein